MGAKPFIKSNGVVRYDGIDRANWRVPLVLSVQVEDLDQDIVHPAGLRPNPAAPLYANMEHKAYTNNWATLRDLSLKAVPLDGGGTASAKVGWSYFDRDSPASRGMFALVEKGVLAGASVEFVPDPARPPRDRGFPSVNQHRQNNPRNALEFDAAILLGVAHCEMPVNPLCGVILPDPEAVKAFAEKAIRDRRLGPDPLAPVFHKALARYTPASTTVSVPGSPRFGKSDHMEPNFDQPPMPDEATLDAPAEPLPEDSGTPPTAQAGYDLAQGIEDLITACEGLLAKSEHMKGKAKLQKLHDDLRGCAEEASAIADMVSGDVSGEAKKEAPEGKEGEDAPEPKDDEPELKAIRKSVSGLVVTGTGYRPRRFHASDLMPAQVPAAKSVTPAERRLARDLRKKAREILMNIPKQ